VTGVAVVVGIISALAPLVASQEGIHVNDEYLKAHELDPIIVAMGITTHDTTLGVHRRQADAENQVWAAAADHPELKGFIAGTTALEDLADQATAAVDDSALSVIAARQALEPAVETLYDKLRQTEQARTIGNQWRQCMASDGYTYDDPVQVEARITELNRTRNFNSIPRLLESRDRCLAAVESATERLVLQLLPDWKTENSTLLSAYDKALESHTID
jgi:hypothetical protein